MYERAQMAQAKKRVILDVDVGTDDYLALLLFLHAEKLGQVKIEAIICTMANTTLDNVCKNVVRLLELIGRTDIPVYRGASCQLIPPKDTIEIYHGLDGFGGLSHDEEPDLSIVKKIPAAVAVRDLVVNNPNEISLICLAALTNAALAIRLYDDLAENLKDLWIMGGNYTARGNVTATAEFNFYTDPEAAAIVLSSVKKPIYLLTWEPCLLPQITFDWRYHVFGKKTNPEIQLLTRAEKSVYGYEKPNSEYWIPCDAFLAAAYINPTKFIMKTSIHHASVELHGYETRGQIVLDHLKCKTPNVTIIEEVDWIAFKDFLMQL